MVIVGYPCICVDTKELECQSRAAVLMCVCVFLSLPQAVRSELNNLAQLQASSVNSVTMQFLPEICKESKEHRNTLTRTQYVSVLHRPAFKYHVVL